jgi:phage-related holin
MYYSFTALQKITHYVMVVCCHMMDEIYQHQSYLCLWSHYMVVLIQVACHCVEQVSLMTVNWNE